MTYANQFEYDNAAEPELSDYRDEPAFSVCAEYGMLELLNGRDWRGLSSEILLIDIECLGGGYQMALEWVSDRVTERDYRSWCDYD